MRFAPIRGRAQHFFCGSIFDSSIYPANRVKPTDSMSQKNKSIYKPKREKITKTN